MMGLGGLGLDKQLGAIMNANRANPAALQGKIAQQQKAGVTPQLLEVLASQKLLKEKQAAKTALMASQQQNPATIAQQQDQALRQGAMADLQNEMGVAKQVGMANNMKARQRQKAMTDLQKMLTGGKKPRGIAGAPVPRPMKAAQGGIVGFADGNQVKDRVEQLKQLITESANPQEKLQEMVNYFNQAQAGDLNVQEFLDAIKIIQQSPEFMEDATRSSLIGTMPPQPKERISSNVLGTKLEDQRVMYDTLKNMPPAEKIKLDAVMAGFGKQGMKPVDILQKYSGMPHYAVGTPEIRELMNLGKFNQGGIVGFQSGNSVDLPSQVQPKPPIRLHTGVIERQRERREWDELYGDNYNTDGTLKNVATPSNVVGQNLNEQGGGLPALTEGAEYLPGDRRIIPKGPDFATQKFLQEKDKMPTGNFEETGITPPMPGMTLMPMQGPPMPPPMQGPPMPPPSTETAPQGIKSLQYQPKDNLAAVLRAFQGGNPAAVASLLGERDRQNKLAVDKFNIESDLKLQKLENDRLATQINKELKQAIERGENRNALFGRLSTAQKLIQNATESFNSSVGRSLKVKLDEYKADYFDGPSERKLKRYQAAEEAYNQALNRALGDLPSTSDAIKEAIARLDFDTSRPATQI